MRQKLQKLYKALIITAVLIISICFSKGTINKAIAAEQKVTVSPPYIMREVLFLERNQILKDQIKLSFEEKNESMNIEFLESDYKFESIKKSPIFEEISKINTSSMDNDIIIDIELNPQRLESRTYNFILSINLNNSDEKTYLSNNVTIRIPYILTINGDIKDETSTPEFSIIPKRKFYVTLNNILINTQVINQTDKIIEFGGELIVLDKSTIMYSEKISGEDNSLVFPKTVRSKLITIKDLPKKGPFPYFGKVEVLIRGSVSGKRHIETSKVSIWIIPYQIIILALAVLTLLMFGSWKLYRKKGN